MILDISSEAANIRSATPLDRDALYNLLHYGNVSHRHMDWKAPLDWIGCDPFLVLQKFNRPTALIACPPDPSEVAWIRAFAVGSLLDPTSAWDRLWETAREHLSNKPNVERAISIALDDWYIELLKRSGFTHHTNILMLSWENRYRLPPPPSKFVSVRPMTEADLPAVAIVDRAAFQPVWHNSPDSLEMALMQSLIATVSEDADGITGYQISTPSPFGGHLARLAVLPEKQGNGIGYGMIYDLLQRFQAKGALRVTVNTQEYNIASTKIYEKAGFHLTGEKYPVYEYNLRG
jgi:ribosomal-protein-alanine N-acetyltransferase